MREAWLVLGVVAFLGCERGRTGEQEAQSAEPAQAGDSLSITGDFATPESVLYHETGDVYLVSNINGDPFAKDDNGFISIVSPEGSIRELKWVDGAQTNITLHAPKGLAIRGDTLFVADIDSVRAFGLTTGTALGGRGVPGSTFLNDLVTGPDGTLYVSDTGMKPGFVPSGSDAVFRFTARGPEAVARGEWLSRPNGLATGPEGLTIVPFASKVIFRVRGPGSAPDTIANLPAGSLDGVVRIDGNQLLVSSWDAKTVYHVDVPGQQAHPLVTNVDAPADIGYDSKRRRVLVPLFNENRIEVRRVP